MAKKKEVHKIGPLTENNRNIISALINEYDIETACKETTKGYL